MKININEKFPHLRNAPIVEAVIAIRARAEVDWEEQKVSEHLKARLQDYPQMDSQSEWSGKIMMEPSKPPEAITSGIGWKGLRFQSADKLHIAQFNRNDFVFSRLHPYDTWEQLYNEAMRLWHMYTKLARPLEAQRIGLRYINRIELPPQELRFEDYIQPTPLPPREMDLPFGAFFHKDTLIVPQRPYAINIVRTIQPPQTSDDEKVVLILDIDVFTTMASALDEKTISLRLNEMQWLKNKAFFGSITTKALERFK